MNGADLFQKIVNPANSQNNYAMYPPGYMPYNQQQMYYQQQQQMQYNPQQGFMGYPQQQQQPQQGQNGNFFNNFLMHNLQNSGQNRNNGYWS